MQAIITHTERKNKQVKVVATSASGRTRSKQCWHQPLETDHREVARELSIALGFGKELSGGETKIGFAYLPVSNNAPSFESVERAAKTLMQAAGAFPSGEKDPIRLAAGIMDLVKAEQ